MQVRETTLEDLIGGKKQFRIPLFQRPYTWREANLAQLWRDILAQYEGLRSEPSLNGSGHFLGSFVLAPYPAPASAVTSFVVVDGQQRLTTLLLALAALRDTAALVNPEARDRFNETYLLNRWQQGHDRYRLLPSKPDQPSFVAVVDDEPGKGSRTPIGDAYRYFAARFSEPDRNDEPLDADLLELAITRRLVIVDITAQSGDNVHRIFESLNATGVSLTQADLLRNYFMMLLPTRADAVYEEVWLPMQQAIGAENLEGLARVDLQRRGIQVRTDDVYREQQKRLQPIEHDEAAVEDEIRDLALRARHYAVILNPTRETNSGIRDRLRFLDRWGAQTAHPLLMYLFELREDGGLAEDEVETALAYLESFLVRRLLTGASRKNLNRIFPTVVRRLRERPEGQGVPDALRLELSGERLYWASDDKINAAVQAEPFYFSGRAIQRRMVLERIEESYGHKELGDLSELSLQVEHILPQTLSDEWRDQLIENGENPDETHAELKHTIGNLTLSGYNAELSNKPFERKQQIYEASHLSLNAALSQHGAWGREAIRARAEELARRVVEIWKPPAEVAALEPSGPDWTRMHAAVAAIPPGYWTTYGDLGELVGSSAQGVASHIMANLHLLNLHRVLTSSGTPAEGFRWPDLSDTRDVRDVLETEGVLFRDDGSADPSSRLNSDELVEIAGLLEEVTEEDDAIQSEWDDALIQRCFRESPLPMQGVLQFLAANPDRTVVAAQIAEAVSRTPNQLRGVLGAFGNRVKNRYGMDSWPFEAEWSDEAGGVLYRMPEHVARVIHRSG